MGLLSIFQRNKQASAQPVKGRGGRSAARQAPLANTPNPADTAEAVREARARASRTASAVSAGFGVLASGAWRAAERPPRPFTGWADACLLRWKIDSSPMPSH